MPRQSKVTVKTALRLQGSSTKASLRPPTWLAWFKKGKVNLQQAALLSVGREPAAGIVPLLRHQKPREFVDYIARFRQLKADYGLDPWLKRGSGTVKVVGIRELLEYAVAAGWKLPKNVSNALVRLRQQHLAAVASASDVHVVASSLHPTTAVAPPPQAATTTTELGPSSAEVPLEPAKLSRRDSNLQRILGALLLHVHAVAKERNAAKFLRGPNLNVSAVASLLVETISRDEGSELPISSFGQRAVETHLSEALKLFGHGSAV